MIPAENNTSSTHVTDMVKTVFWDCKAKLLEVLPAKTFSVEKFTVVPIKIWSSVETSKSKVESCRSRSEDVSVKFCRDSEGDKSCENPLCSNSFQNVGGRTLKEK